MNKFSLKTLGASLLTFGLVLAGAAAPAHAAAGVTITTPVPTFVANSPTPAFTITVDSGGPTIDNTAAGFQLSINVEQWTNMSSCPASPDPVLSNCGISSVTGTGISSVTVYRPGPTNLFIRWSGSTSSVTIAFAAGAFTTGAAGQATLAASIGPVMPLTRQISVVNSAPTTYTVTFDANGGTGTMSDQTASAGTALTANSFTRSGFTFSGWNTVADGSGTAYGNSATTFPFTSNATLYAQWAADSSGNNSGGGSSSPSLANTGLVALPLAVGGLSTAVLGAGLIFLARRRTQ